MNYKVKSFLYFASLVIAAIVYNTMDSNMIQDTQLANNTIEHVSTPEALN